MATTEVQMLLEAGSLDSELNLIPLSMWNSRTFGDWELLPCDSLNFINTRYNYYDFLFLKRFSKAALQHQWNIGRKDVVFRVYRKCTHTPTLIHWISTWTQVQWGKLDSENGLHSLRAFPLCLGENRPEKMVKTTTPSHVLRKSRVVCMYICICPCN